jgi:glycosyltransferase involved in cell wall biosynthesis
VIKYCFDGYIRNQACGWIIDLSKPGTKFHIALFVAGQIVSVTEASEYRRDLEEAGLADGKSGFTIPLPEFMEGECYLQVVELQKPIQESMLHVKVLDAAASILFNGKDFSKYKQIQDASKIRPTFQLPNKSIRLKNTLSQCVDFIEGTPIPRYAAWAIERHRRGGAGFFSSGPAKGWADVAWYLFEYESSDKEIVTIGMDNPLVMPLGVAPLQKMSPLYVTWLLRKGDTDFHSSTITDEKKCEFLASLLNTNTNAPFLSELESLKLPVSKKPRSVRLIYLPRLSKYLLWKYQASYATTYDIQTEGGYLAFLFDMVIHSSDIELPYFGREIITFLKQPIQINDASVTRFELVTWLFSKRVDTPNFTISEDIDFEEVHEYYNCKWLATHPQHALLGSTVKTPRTAMPPSIRVVAHWDSGSGLTQNAIMSVKALHGAGIPVTLLYPSGEVYTNLSSASSVLDLKVEVKRDAILLHVNADEAPDTLIKLSHYINLDATHIIGFYLWELEEIPRAHLLGLELVDEIWAPSEFVYEAYKPICGKKVKPVTKALQVPSDVKHNREKFGIPKNNFAVLLSFDYHSCVERKNPVVAVQGFLQAFGEDPDVTLVVKTTEYSPNHWGDPFLQWNSVKSLAETDERIIVIEDFLPNDEFFELINSCDAVVSTHRAEGFGYLPAYAIWLGKSVISTAYSGTNEYCTKENSYMVDYSLVPVPAAKFIYPMLRPMWAEVKMDSLITQYHNCRKSIKKDRISHSKSIRQRYSFEQLTETYRNYLTAADIIPDSPATKKIASLESQ